MPMPLIDAVDANANVAVTKARQVGRLPAYLLSSMLAGAFVGIAVVLLISVSAPLVAAGSPWAKLIQGSVFGIALTLVVFAGAELFTGNAMVMLQGLANRTVTGKDLAAVWAASLVGNIVGSVGFAALVHGGGSFAPPARALVKAIVAAKDAATGTQLFWRAVLCNMLVCLALWMAGRAQGDGAKLAVLWWALLAFISSGFEHSIANVTTFALGVFDGTATWAQLGRNLAWTLPGNVVGGGLLVGLAYTWISRPAPAPAPAVRPGPATDPVLPEPAMA